jgi:hypothetical protein
MLVVCDVINYIFYNKKKNEAHFHRHSRRFSVLRWFWAEYGLGNLWIRLTHILCDWKPPKLELHSLLKTPKVPYRYIMIFIECRSFRFSSTIPTMLKDIVVTTLGTIGLLLLSEELLISITGYKMLISWKPLMAAAAVKSIGDSIASMRIWLIICLHALTHWSQTTRPPK